eukprot:TRINITY_DN1817_c0_g1_i4.p2 TRINITY_DN1817_c0_g1~~TRINITY_DN1817_c0_g1_i4.p2  ORF type:complete len:309 (+),score=99.45 TRINITY_DN1817_c0_g1_i4:1290-2216(+)
MGSASLAASALGLSTASAMGLSAAPSGLSLRTTTTLGDVSMISGLGQKVEKAAVRPPTPTLEAAAADDFSGRIAAVLLLQRLLRGRAAQNTMYEGLRRRRLLIEELITGQPLRTGEEGEAPAAETAAEEAAAAQIEEVTAEPTQDETAQALAESAVAQVVADTLDFLAKQQVRMRDHDRLLRTAALAERTRKQRETAETERRARERALLAQTDLVYEEVARVNYETADSFLDTLTFNAVDVVATEQALEKVAHEEKAEATLASVGTDVLYLLESFLIPTVEKESHAQKQNQEDKKFSKAIADTLLPTL